MIKKLALVLLSVTGSVAVGHATTPGTDNANDAAYNSGWTNGTDGGTPATFGAWDLTNNNNGSPNFAGYFIGDSTAGAGNVNTNSKSFAIFANPSTAHANAARNFDSALAVGQSFSLDMAVNFRNGNKGFDLRNGTTAIFTLNIGNNAYTVSNAATGNGDLFSDTYDANTVFHLTLKQTSAGGGTWQVDRSGGLTGTASGTYSGSATGFQFFNSGTDNGNAANNLYFNNLSVSAVPEPSTLALLTGPALLGAWFYIRRRRAS
jgi:PEP-CTERM motif